MVKHVWKGIGGREIPAGASESTWSASDGTAIRRIDWRRGDGPPRGSILFLPGRGDFYEKYLETFDYWASKGWCVTAADWRGQAGSAGPQSGPPVGDIADFSVWVDDLAHLYQIWRAQTPGPHVVIGHSMGGHLVLRTLAEQRIAPDAVVLSAPMLGFATVLPRPVQRVYAALMVRLGDPARPAWKNSEKPGARVALRANLLTHDETRYADEQWWRAQRPWLALGPASWRWLKKSSESFDRLDAPGMLERVTTPVLLLATRHDALVSWPAIARAAQRLPKAQLVAWGREARHELLRECDAVRDRVLASIDEFLEREAPQRQDTAAMAE
ncbi:MULTISPECIES: alpha/beta fold hydrolase [unclassified Novosphingobium]|uniref:alpha/beta fold hydrolase n=1 Tax=unclassified Novosphingobium TaxID=2644732 RepID=UPI000D2FAF63|nr:MULTISPECIES: alpha/beta hydrolase [unclassified Novosphingobium]PTR12473.1 lysophospholipase [Novosphingobium sp. GV055]PUB05874.1 lysophospholipase [Novosphingobium sp. GV061]PUB22107.1 lysophospholipase [Novosphingobium sp. GV079]PUB43880.1 lysophospholipase [Novosphingobium sp. GV027]